MPARLHPAAPIPGCERLRQAQIMASSNSGNPDAWVGRRVVDVQGDEIGSVDDVWFDASTQGAEFIGIKTGAVFGRTHLVPAAGVQPRGDAEEQVLQVSYTADAVRSAPHFTPGEELASVDKERVLAHFGRSAPNERVTDISELRPDQSGGRDPNAPRPGDPASGAPTGEVLPESEHTAAEHAFPTNRALENLTNEAHGT